MEKKRQLEASEIATNKALEEQAAEDIAAHEAIMATHLAH